MFTYTIYKSLPRQVGITFKPTPGLLLEELRRLIRDLEKVAKEMEG